MVTTGYLTITDCLHMKEQCSGVEAIQVLVNITSSFVMFWRVVQQVHIELLSEIYIGERIVFHS